MKRQWMLMFGIGVASGSTVFADCVSISTSFDRVRVRESAHLKSRVIGVFEKNVEVPGIPSGDQWFEIAGGDYPGAFVATEFLKVRLNRDRPECADVWVSVVARGKNIRLREKPDLDGAVVGTIQSTDAAFDVTRGPAGWLKIMPPHAHAGAYISEDWVKILSEKEKKATPNHSE